MKLKNPESNSEFTPKESIYGSRNRLNWLTKFLTKKQKIIDLGCGTGSMITIPLISKGYDIIGIDLDKKSIEFGKNILRENNLDPDRLLCTDFLSTSIEPDIIILSEVLEHLSSSMLNEILTMAFKKLKPNGSLLITVPNGYGCFELESFLWNKLKLGKLLEKIFIVEAIIILKNKILGNTIELYPSTLDSSPHVQRFTYKSIEEVLKQNNFTLIEKLGGSLISGPFSNLFFTGIKPVMKLNLFLGKIFSPIASDFYIAVQKKHS
jgi:2-polyprenyl-3-methyl-5-hydroxy-6-metoxy-1,4-benzoquinol methylase